jgi:hypothetical protein
VNRRGVITLLGAAAAWPLTARAQQAERVRRIGVLMSAIESDPRALEYITAFAQGLAELGWIVGRNVRIEYRWGAGDVDRFRSYAAELVALSPDVVVATAGRLRPICAHSSPASSARHGRGRRKARENGQNRAGRQRSGRVRRRGDDGHTATTRQ